MCITIYLLYNGIPTAGIKLYIWKLLSVNVQKAVMATKKRIEVTVHFNLLRKFCETNCIQKQMAVVIA